MKPSRGLRHTLQRLSSYCGEYERKATASINANLGPITTLYLKALISRLEDQGFRGNLLIMQAYSGLVPVATGVENSVALVDSGPVAEEVIRGWNAWWNGCCIVFLLS